MYSTQYLIVQGRAYAISGPLLSWTPLSIIVQRSSAADIDRNMDQR